MDEVTELTLKKGFLLGNLAQSDYKTIKHAEGVISEEEWEEAKTQRAAWRTEINEIDAQLAELITFDPTADPIANETDDEQTKSDTSDTESETSE